MSGALAGGNAMRENVRKAGRLLRGSNAAKVDARAALRPEGDFSALSPAPVRSLGSPDAARTGEWESGG